MVKRMGPSTEPCGTPWFTGASGELDPFMETNCCLLDRYEWNQERTDPVMLRWVERRLRRMEWEMVSKAAEIQQNQDTDAAYISSHEEIVGDLEQCGLCAVMCSVARLEGFEEVMVGHVLMELCSYCSFQSLTEER